MPVTICCADGTGAVFWKLAVRGKQAAAGEQGPKLGQRPASIEKATELHSMRREW